MNGEPQFFAYADEDPMQFNATQQMNFEPTQPMNFEPVQQQQIPQQHPGRAEGHRPQRPQSMPGLVHAETMPDLLSNHSMDPKPGQVPNVSVPKGSKPMLMVGIGGGRYVVVSQYRGVTLIHIREYVTDAVSGKQYATKKGIGLKVNQWEVVKKVIRQVDQAVSLYEKKK